MPLAGFDDAFQIVQPREPSLDFMERRGVEGVEPGLRHPPLPDQPGTAQHAKVLRDRRPTHREEAGNLAGGALL